MRLLLTASLFLFCNSAALAQSQDTDIRKNALRIKGDALLESFLNTTHDGAYNFTEEGEPQRFYKETHHEDSKVTYTEDDGNPVDGLWSIRRNLLCFQYPGQKMSGGCFRVYKVGNCFYYYNNDIPEYGFEIDRDYWTARSVKAGEEPNCEAMVS